MYLDYFIDEDRRDQNGEILRNEFDELIGLSETKKAFRAHFNNDPFELFRAFQTLLTLNLYDVDKKTKQELYRSNSLYLNETVPVLASEKRVMRFKEFEILKGDSNVSILSKSLSDGEHQYLHAMGICLLFKNTNSLFLLDEPETHFNPKWRREFISLLTDLVSNVNQDYFLTSHSPFIVADTKREYVYVFRRNKNKLEVEWPLKETYGSDFDYILQSAFDLDTSLSKKSFDEMQSLLKNGTLKEIEEGINDFGESAEKLFLFKKLQELKGKVKKQKI